MPKANSTILGDVTRLNASDSTFYSRAGLIWAAQKVQEIKLAPPELHNRISSVCEACRSFFSGSIDRNGLLHQPGLVALNASASSCDFCCILLMSLDGRQPLETWIQTVENLSPEDDGDADNDSLTDKIKKSQNEADEIVIFEIAPDFASPLLQRVRAVWQKVGVVGFQLPGDVVGFARLQDDGPTSRLIWREDDCDDWVARYNVLVEWMGQCRSKHPNCLCDDDTLLPSRVIDVEAFGSSDSVRLVVSSREQVGRYTALSYCWGSDHKRVAGITRKETLAARLQHISFQELPLTLRDAIKVTRKLRIRFLWVDALCIIQDDLQDWQRESAKMGTVYSNATITLAATSAATCDEGLLLPFRPAFHGEGMSKDEKVAFRLGHIHSRPPAYPLHTRGWTLQETCLSRRTLNFTSRQVIWQCATETLCEDGVFDGTDEVRDMLSPMLAVMTDHSLSSQVDWYQQWKRIAEAHSQRQLTYERDKVPALAGITSVFQHKLADEPLVGLWQNDLVNGLLWKSRALVAGRPLQKVPSWSWLACPSEIEYDKVWVSLSKND